MSQITAQTLRQPRGARVLDSRLALKASRSLSPSICDATVRLYALFRRQLDFPSPARIYLRCSTPIPLILSGQILAAKKAFKQSDFSMALFFNAEYSPTPPA
jgi:hypothetical protein